MLQSPSGPGTTAVPGQQDDGDEEVDVSGPEVASLLVHHASPEIQSAEHKGSRLSPLVSDMAIDRTVPPIMIIHGTADTLVPLSGENDSAVYPTVCDEYVTYRKNYVTSCVFNGVTFLQTPKSFGRLCNTDARETRYENCWRFLYLDKKLPCVLNTRICSHWPAIQCDLLVRLTYWLSCLTHTMHSTSSHPPEP